MLKQKEISNIKAIRTRHMLTFFQYLFAIVFTLIIVFPFYWMIITSLKTSEELLRPVPTLWPLKFQWNNYVDVFKMAPLGQYILNTIIMTIGVMTLQIIIGSFAAYGFSKGKFPGRDILFIVVLGALMVPIQVTFVPIYVMIAKLKWINTFAGLIVPNAVSAYTIFMLRQTFKSVDDAFIEAAQLEGLGRIGIIFRLLIPLCKPTMLTVTLITFLSIIQTSPLITEHSQHGTCRYSSTDYPCYVRSHGMH